MVDRVGVVGWAYDDEERQSASVEVLIDGVPLAEIVGTEFRPDLVQAGVGDGHHGFRYVFDGKLTFGVPSVLTVRFARTRAVLAGGERVVAGEPIGKEELFQDVLAHGQWRLDDVESEDDGITVTGWGVPPFGLPVPSTVLRDGRVPNTIVRFERFDVVDQLGLRGRDAQFGFRCHFAGGSAADGYNLAFADARTLRPFSPFQTMHELPDRFPLPEEHRRLRVAGLGSDRAYRMVGATAFVRLDQVVRTYFGRSFSEASAVLDWGCGCARVLRYAPRLEVVTGLDIDADNIDWCRANIPDATFAVVPPWPPTSLAAGAFDVVFAISVMTHLTEENHLAWLQELRRITAPSAAVLLTVHGETAWLEGGMTLAKYGMWRANGFAVLSKNRDLDDSGADASLYFNAFISRRYVYEVWSEFFEVLDVIPGAVINQDLVVLRRRDD
jgi:hypothetical protein